MKQTFCLQSTVHNLPLSCSSPSLSRGPSFLAPQTSHRAAHTAPWAINHAPRGHNICATEISIRLKWLLGREPG